MLIDFFKFSSHVNNSDHYPTTCAERLHSLKVIKVILNFKQRCLESVHTTNCSAS